jgi:TRAP-type C4-dicarboxylate transport system permease small subunit
MRVYTAIASALRAAQEYIVIFTGAAGCLLITAAAIARYVFSVDFYGSEELIMLTAFWLYFIGASLATREDTHISADLLTGLMKTAGRKKILKTVQHVISLLVSTLAASWAYKYIVWSWARNPKTPVLKFPVIWMQIPILVFFVLSSLYLFAHVVRDMLAFRRRSRS